VRILVLLVLFQSLLLSVFSGSEIPTEIEKVDLKLSSKELAITFLKLSSGEATLIQHGNGENVLINTGGPETQSELENLLKMYNVTLINSIIITKDDPEYQSNLEWLTKKYPTSKIVIGHLFSPPSFIPKERVTKWKKDSGQEIVPGLKAEVIYEGPSSDGLQSYDLFIKLGRHYLLYMSTANISVETSLLTNEELSKVNIIKIPNFAQNDGSSQDFIEHIDPQVAIIFTKKNQNPSPDVMERLKETWIDTYMTKQFGNITIKANQNEYEVITISIESSQEIQ
jgi:competence protein ComEC